MGCKWWRPRVRLSSHLIRLVPDKGHLCSPALHPASADVFFFPFSGLVDGERGCSWLHISAGNVGNSNNYGVAAAKTPQL